MVARCGSFLSFSAKGLDLRRAISKVPSVVVDLGLAVKEDRSELSRATLNAPQVPLAELPRVPWLRLELLLREQQDAADAMLSVR